MEHGRDRFPAYPQIKPLDMAKIELTKPHAYYGKAGTVVDVSTDRAGYLQRVGAAKEYKEPRQTKELKTERKTKKK